MMAATEYPDLTRIFSDFTQLKVLIIGDVMVDAYVWGKVERISPEAPVPVLSVGRREKRLGGAANVALNIQALGATPLLCGVVGDDAAGDAFITLLQEQRISPVRIGRRSTHRQKSTDKGSKKTLGTILKYAVPETHQ